MTSNVNEVARKIAESDAYATKTHILRSQTAAYDTKDL